MKDPQSRHIDAVTFADRRDPLRRVVIRPRFAIDAEIEGDVCHLAGVSTTLRREARGPSDDPTRDNESFAGRLFTPAKKIGPLVVAGGALMDGSTQQADEAPATMAWNGSVTLKDYGEGTADSPWVLTKQPAGYDPADFAWWEDDRAYGVTLDEKNCRWNIDHFLSTIEGRRLPAGWHVLESMDIRDRRPNEPAVQLTTGQKPVHSAAWRIEGGQLHPVETTGNTYFLVDAGAPDVDVSVDVFLEQTKNEAVAGLVFQASDSRQMQRLLLQAKGPAVEVRIDSVVEGERKQEERWLMPTMNRGLTLRVVAKGGDVLYFLDGKEIKHLQRTYAPSATLAGVVNGGGESSRFDNLDVRVPENE